MTLSFNKYHGAGNDFIIIDERDDSSISNRPDKEAVIATLCNRRFGIGADGMMLLRSHTDYDFEMIYFNSDGKEGSMCGNGGRCLVAFAHHMGIITKECHFIATDGDHRATVLHADGNKLEVSLQMNEVVKIQPIYDGFFLDTGSPHFVRFVSQLEQIDVYNQGKTLRHDPVFGSGGTNVNFVELKDDILNIRTFERGVEDETLACGTGITAAAIAAHHSGIRAVNSKYDVQAMGGRLSVSFSFQPPSVYSNVFLQGPAERVFEGKIDI